MNGEKTFSIRIEKACESCCESCPFFEYDEYKLYALAAVEHTIRRCKHYNVCNYISEKMGHATEEEKK